jgi:elongation factor G
MDRVGADFYNVIEQINTKLRAKAVPLQIPIGVEDDFSGMVDLITEKAYIWPLDNHELGAKFEVCDVPEELKDEVFEWREKLIETVAESDENLLERFFEDRSAISVDEFKAVTRKAVINGEFVPVFCGSSFKNKGVQPLLDAVVDYLPSPVDVGPVKGIEPKTEKNITRDPSPSEPFAALCFKIATNSFVGKLAYLRVYSGRIEAKSQVFNLRTQKLERLNRLFQMHANKQKALDAIQAGDICTVVGFKDIKTGDTLCDKSKQILLEKIKFPEPVIGLAIEPQVQADVDKLTNALAKLSEEDPTFTVDVNDSTGQTVISGMGELHLEILIDRLKQESKVGLNQGAPHVNYKESLCGVAKYREVFKKQTGGKGKFADILIEVGEVDDGVTGFQFINKVKGGNIPKEFISSVEKGFRQAMNSGPIAGYPLESLKVTLIDGSYHPIDSDSLSFEIAARRAFREAAKMMEKHLLEPIMKLEVVTPEEYMGDVVADLNRRRGEIRGMEEQNGARIVKANVPLAEQFGYVTVLRTLTSGRATSSMEFSHFEAMPKELEKKILEKGMLSF